MSVVTLLQSLRKDNVWTEEARVIYTTRRFMRFFSRYPELCLVACSYAPDNRVLWDGFFRFFYGHFPTMTDEHIVHGKVEKRSWWYNEEVYDPKWERLIRVHRASLVYHRLIRPQLLYQSRK
jgi:hypothetical protein